MILTVDDVVWGVILSAWVAFVTLKVSKWIASKTSIYVARKTIHMLGGGMVAILAPFVFTSPLVPILASYVLTAYLIYVRLSERKMGWFMEENNKGEVYFTFSYGTLLLLMWIIEPNYWGTKDVYIPLVPIYYMSFGDGVTGIIRNYVYKQRRKGLWGSLGMFLVSAPIGYYFFGPIGLASAVLATLVELIKNVDDNLTVPFSSFAFLLIFIKFL